MTNHSRSISESIASAEARARANVSSSTMRESAAVILSALAQALLLAVVTTTVACSPATPCSNNSDCLLATDPERQIGICSARGFCRSECDADEDCPCGSYCADGCGVCIRDDRAGPATCFGADNAYSTAELLSVCAVDARHDESMLDGGASDAGTSRRRACPPDAPLPSCDRIDAGQQDSNGEDGGTGEADSGPPAVDAGVSDGVTDAGVGDADGGDADGGDAG